MASPAEHAQIVLSAILPNRRDLLERATTVLSPEHFPEPAQRALYQFLERYALHTGGGVLPKKYLSDVLRDRVEVGKALQYEELWQTCADQEVTDEEFIWSSDQLRDEAARQATGEALTEAMEILRQGKQDGADMLKGHEDARRVLLHAFQEIDREITRDVAPEGDVKDEYAEMMAEYAQTKQDRLDGKSQGILTGIEEIDRKLGGFRNGELVMLAGYSSDGKSSLAAQIAWHAAVMQGKNVLFFTTETLRPQMRRKIQSRHSKLPQFNLPDGLNAWDLKMGTLPDEMEASFQAVVQDLAKNPEYGHIYISQMDPDSDLNELSQRAHRINRQFHVDIIFLDMLNLISAEKGNKLGYREEMAQRLKNAKRLAVGFDSGRGVPFVTPWQVNREAREKAETSGGYVTRGMSETSEATNSADVILGLLNLSEERQRYSEIIMQILKARDAEQAHGITVEVDYATSTFHSRTIPGLDGLRQQNDGRGSIFGNEDFGDLIA